MSSDRKKNPARIYNYDATPSRRCNKRKHDDCSRQRYGYVERAKREIHQAEISIQCGKYDFLLNNLIVVCLLPKNKPP